MNKKVRSIILTCLILLSFLLLIWISIDTGISIYRIKNTPIDSSNDTLPGASIIGFVISNLAIWVGWIFYSFFIASIGFLSSLINIKIAQNPLIVKMSNVFLYIFFVVIIFAIGISIYYAIKIV